MKKILITLILSLTGFAVSGQKADFDSFFTCYTGKTGFTTMDFSGSLLRMMSGGDFAEAFSGINSMRLIVAEGGEVGFARDVEVLTSNGGFTRLFNVDSGGTEIFQVWYKEKGKGSGKSRDRSEYLLVARDGDEITVIYIDGQTDLTGLSGITKLGKSGK